MESLGRPTGSTPSITAQHAANKVAIEKRDRGIQSGVQFAAPFVPGVEIQIAAGHPFAATIENVQVIAVLTIEIEKIERELVLRTHSRPAATNRTSARHTRHGFANRLGPSCRK